ncbi:hypothetical protein AB0K48_00880 [Nonomuraea sp. NPDC055795]
MLVVEPFVLAWGVPQVVFVPGQAAVQEFVAAGLHPSLHDRVHARHPDAGEYGLDACVGEDLVQASRVPPCERRESAQVVDARWGIGSMLPVRLAGTGVTLFHQVAAPAQDGVRADEEPQSAQYLAGQRGQERGEKGPVFGGESHSGVGTELAFEDGDLVAQSEYLHVLAPVAHGQQPQHCERVPDREVGQAKEHG